jgi:hypothetical protein
MVKFCQEGLGARHQCLTPVILATQETEIRRIMVLSQPRQIVCKTLSQKHTTQKRASRVAEVVERLPSKHCIFQTDRNDTVGTMLPMCPGTE